MDVLGKGWEIRFLGFEYFTTLLILIYNNKNLFPFFKINILIVSIRDG